MLLSGKQRKKLRDALIGAFPNKPSLEQFLSFELDQDLNRITSDSDLEYVVFQVIRRAESEGWLIELVIAVRDNRPKNQTVQAVAQEFLQNQTHPEPNSQSQEIKKTEISTISEKENNLIQPLELSPKIVTHENLTSPNEKDQSQTFSFKTVTVNHQGKIINQETKSAHYFTENLGNNITLEMVAIPGGKFLMGSPEDEAGRYDNESPQHEVTVPPFFMGKYPVTQAQWRAVAALPQVNRELEPDPSYFKGDNLPVENICWYDAVEFCDRISKHTKLDYRLPSEAEWEYACRAGTTTPFHFGEAITPELANYNGNYTYGSASKGEYRQQTTPVGSFNVANAFGLYDMHGSIWEWCADTWHDDYRGAPVNGSSWIGENIVVYRMLRGGSWGYDPRNCRSACRDGDAPDDRNDFFGFRVVVSAART